MPKRTPAVRTCSATATTRSTASDARRELDARARRRRRSQHRARQQHVRARRVVERDQRSSDARRATNASRATAPTAMQHPRRRSDALRRVPRPRRRPRRDDVSRFAAPRAPFRAGGGVLSSARAKGGDRGVATVLVRVREHLLVSGGDADRERAAAAAGVDVAWRPFLLGPIFQAQGWNDSPFNVYPVKGRYMWRDLERICRKEGIAVPPSVALSASEPDRRARRVPRRRRALGARPSCARSTARTSPRIARSATAEVIATILTTLGLDARAHPRRGRRRPRSRPDLRANTDEAIALGDLRRAELRRRVASSSGATTASTMRSRGRTSAERSGRESGRTRDRTWDLLRVKQAL